jgi:FkbM family methyltransferase
VIATPSWNKRTAGSSARTDLRLDFRPQRHSLATPALQLIEENPMRQNEAVAALQSVEITIFNRLSHRLTTRCMIDVGAHHGSTLLPFLQAGWRVHAFEPIAANREVLIARCGSNDQLTIRAEAVSNCSGTKAIHLASRPDGSLHDYYHTLEQTRADRYHRKGKVVQVPVVSLDDLVARGELPKRNGFLKIDTEGHDLTVLHGAARLECEVISVEFWCDRHPLGKSPSPASEMIRLLTSRGYDSYLVLCHHGGGTLVVGSDLTDIPPDAWGNMLFFHSSCRKLYQELYAQLAMPVPHSPAGWSDRRLTRILSLAFPERRGLTVLQTTADGGQFLESLRAGFPESKAMSLPSAGTSGGPLEAFHREGSPADTVDLIRMERAADGGKWQSMIQRASQSSRPAVLVRVVPLESENESTSFYEAMQLMRATDYRLTSMLNAEISQEGLMAAADLLFLPPALHARCRAAATGFGWEDYEALFEQTRVLQQAADERLNVIRQLEKVAEERLSLIGSLTADFAKLNAEIERDRSLTGCIRRLRELLIVKIRGPRAA